MSHDRAELTESDLASTLLADRLDKNRSSAIFASAKTAAADNTIVILRAVVSRLADRESVKQ